jgi:hypothetical protein
MQFKTSDELEKFAKIFLKQHVDRFRKDINICLTADSKGSHAYFPALISCISLLDLLSGLYAGNLNSHGRPDLIEYANTFMNRKKYDSDRLSILYEAIRHKVAHVGLPYAVFDTSTKPKVFAGARRRITWTVNASRHHEPIRLNALSNPVQLSKNPTPWPVSYDHRIRISVRSFATDIVNSIYACNGYMAFLRSNTAAQKNFEKCMGYFYPPWQS